MPESERRTTGLVFIGIAATFFVGWTAVVNGQTDPEVIQWLWRLALGSFMFGVAVFVSGFWTSLPNLHSFAREVSSWLQQKKSVLVPLVSFFAGAMFFGGVSFIAAAIQPAGPNISQVEVATPSAELPTTVEIVEPSEGSMLSSYEGELDEAGEKIQFLVTGTSIGVSSSQDLRIYVLVNRLQPRDQGWRIFGPASPLPNGAWRQWADYLVGDDDTFDDEVAIRAVVTRDTSVREGDVAAHPNDLLPVAQTETITVSSYVLN